MANCTVSRLNQGDDPDAEKIETPFTAANDVEGLAKGFQDMMNY
jgi:hypothetical protein